MHAAFALLSLLVAIGSGFLCIHILHSINNWSWRRVIQFFVLMLPFVALEVGLAFFHYILMDLWESNFIVLNVLDITVLVGTAAMAIGGVCFGGMRLCLMTWTLKKYQVYSDQKIQQQANAIAQQLAVKPARILLTSNQRPLALTYGIWRPTILLSSWMIEQLDRRELEAVLTHELVHVFRHDYLLILLATIYRDVFFYLPTSKIVYKQIQQEKELVCDELAAQITLRPLALASALIKVWLHSVDIPRLAHIGGVLPLINPKISINQRIQRLAATSSEKKAPKKTYSTVRSFYLLSAFIIVQVMSIIVLISVLGICLNG